MTYVLSCCKTGRWWKLSSEKACRHKAAELGLVDYEIYRGE